MFSTQEESSIISAIEAAESLSRAELRVHYTQKERVDNIFELALQQFQKLEMHKTEERNGVLIFLAPKAKQLAIVGDEGIHLHVGQEFWEQTHAACIQEIQSKGLAQGIILGLALIGHEMAKYFPIGNSNPNELSNEISHD
jgi:uncharacterized membrane protein